MPHLLLSHPDEPPLPPHTFREHTTAELLTLLRSGELDAAAFAAALEDLDRRYEEITARLDSPFELP